jgi:hypothetical protein
VLNTILQLDIIDVDSLNMDLVENDDYGANNPYFVNGGFETNVLLKSSFVGVIITILNLVMAGVALIANRYYESKGAI